MYITLQCKYPDSCQVQVVPINSFKIHHYSPEHLRDDNAVFWYIALLTMFVFLWSLVTEPRIAERKQKQNAWTFWPLTGFPVEHFSTIQPEVQVGCLETMNTPDLNQPHPTWWLSGEITKRKENTLTRELVFYFKGQMKVLSDLFWRSKTVEILQNLHGKRWWFLMVNLLLTDSPEL